MDNLWLIYGWYMIDIWLICGYLMILHTPKTQVSDFGAPHRHLRLAPTECWSVHLGRRWNGPCNRPGAENGGSTRNFSRCENDRFQNQNGKFIGEVGELFVCTCYMFTADIAMVSWGWWNYTPVGIQSKVFKLNSSLQSVKLCQNYMFNKLDREEPHLFLRPRNTSCKMNWKWWRIAMSQKHSCDVHGLNYPLGNCYIAMENDHRNSGYTQ